MGMSILARQDRVSLGNGMVLRLLSAGELLQARRRDHELARSPLEQPLCSNACLVAYLGFSVSPEKIFWRVPKGTPLYSESCAILRPRSCFTFFISSKVIPFFLPHLPPFLNPI